jgi:hypothetical protein
VQDQVITEKELIEIACFLLFYFHLSKERFQSIGGSQPFLVGGTLSIKK